MVLPEWLTNQRIVVCIDRWSLYRGAVVLPEWLTDQRIVVSIDRWSLKQVSLYVETAAIVHCTGMDYVHVVFSLGAVAAQAYVSPGVTMGTVGSAPTHASQLVHRVAPST